MRRARQRPHHNNLEGFALLPLPEELNPILKTAHILKPRFNELLPLFHRFRHGGVMLVVAKVDQLRVEERVLEALVAQELLDVEDALGPRVLHRARKRAQCAKKKKGLWL
jgi:hypothetical protein